MAVDVFLKMDSLKGGSKDKNHPGWIEIEATGLDVSIEPPDQESGGSIERNNNQETPEQDDHSTDQKIEEIKKIINTGETDKKKIELVKAFVEDVKSPSSTPNEPFGMTITKKVDSLSTRLSKAASKREEFTNATIEFCTYDGEQRTYLKYDISGLTAQSYTLDGVQDTFKFKYTKIELKTYGAGKQLTGSCKYSTETQSDAV